MKESTYSALEKGVQLKFVKENVGRLAVLPKRKAYKARVLSLPEVSKILNEAKRDKLQELLGHSTITTTMDIYAHITKKGKENAVRKLE